MCFLRYILLAVTLFAALAGAAPPVLPDIPVRAAHSITVTVPDLHWAALEGDVAEVKRLIATGVDVNATEAVITGATALQWAARGKGGSGAVRALIAAGANLEARNPSGETALFDALRVNDDDNYAALFALLVSGANASVKRTDGGTPLHAACHVDYPSGIYAALLLRAFGADPNATATWDLGGEDALGGASRVTGVTPLHLAATRPLDRFWGDVLFAANFDPHERTLQLNAKDSNGRTPLHWNVMVGDGANDVAVLTWLLIKGADVNAVDNFGATALDWADGTGSVDSAAALRRHGGLNLYVP